MPVRWSLESAGTDAVMLRFGQAMDPALVPVIRAARDRLAEGLGDRVRDLVPSYTTLMVGFDPLRTDADSIRRDISALLADLEGGTREPGALVDIPVWYDPSVGPDLERVARHHGISVDEVVERHSATEYQVYAIGFAPGFAYMGEVAEDLATPRLETPRTSVPVGSVALANRQTAVYPIATPGGWNLLGRTPVRMFDRSRPSLCPVATGDRVRFVAISRAEFIDLGGEPA